MSAAPFKPRPNFLVVVLDDVRFDDFGFNGHPFVSTPNFDRIALEGMNLSNAFASVPLCSPNRACILTGLYAHSHGVIDNTDRSEASHGLVTFACLLHQAGYETGFFGKWHMGLDDTPRPGFDEWACLRGQGAYFDPEVNVNGNRCQIGGYASDIFSGQVAEFIRRARDRPFLACLSHKAVHPNLFQDADGSIRSIPDDGGFTPPESHAGLYEEFPVPRRPNAMTFGRDKPALQRQLDGLGPLGPDTGTPDGVIRNRLRILTAADEPFGSVLEALEDTGQASNTVVVLTSDHGYFYGEHGLNEERRLAYEESIRVPLAVRWPKAIAPGSTSGALVSSVDLAPTLLELARAEPPAKTHGRSLVPILRATDPPNWRQSVLIEHFSDRVWPRAADMGYQAVRTNDWKYIRYVDLEGMDELYDLATDPYEQHNLRQHHASAGVLLELQGELDRLLRETSAPPR